MTRRLDHVAILVRDTERALEYFQGRLGLPVAATQVIEAPAVRLTYLECENVLLQLVEPLDDTSTVAGNLAERGEGLHHICFETDDPIAEAARLADPDAPAPVPGTGRGRRSAFVPGPIHHGVRVELTGGEDDGTHA